MINPEYGSSEFFYDRLNIDREGALQIQEIFQKSLHRAHRVLSVLDERTFNLFTVLPSQDIAPSDIFFEGSTENRILIVAKSKLKGISAIMDITALNFLDKNFIYPKRRSYFGPLIKDNEKKLDCQKTVLPLLIDDKNYNLVKEEFLVLKNKQAETVSINYTLNSVDTNGLLRLE